MWPRLYQSSVPARLKRQPESMLELGRRQCLQRIAVGIAGCSGLMTVPLAHALQARSVGAVPGAALQPRTATSGISEIQFNQVQSRVLRAWISRIIHTQLSRTPSPRWQQRDCAGLVRFAVAESLREHDLSWRKANGLLGQSLPPDIVLSSSQAKVRHRWKLADGSRSAYVGALEMVQENSVFVGKSWNKAQTADLFLFDQGDEQHLMVWMGRYLAYHTGSVYKNDNGLRAVPIEKLLNWRDTRWQPTPDNPNFAGVFRLSFLSPI